MDCIRVEFRVNEPNTRSRTAVLRLGAREEGMLRHHQITPDGRLINWVYYSILRDEWPAIREDLERKLAVHAPA
jgi:RimJ/RimL family protein N-acetyltransferase